MYIATGSYGTGDNVSILDAENFKPLFSFNGGTRPSFVVKHPEKDVIYVVNEMNKKENGTEGRVNTYKLDFKSKKAELLSSLPSLGEDPCFITLDHSLSFPVVANYSSGEVSVFALGEDGNLKNCVQHFSYSGSGPVKERQECSHPHTTVFSPDGKLLYISDLGSDKIRVYKWNSDKKEPADFLQDIILAPGSGPRMVCFGKNKMFGINELANTVNTYSFLNGCYSEIEGSISTLENDVPNTAAHIIYTHDMIICSNRGENSIGCYTPSGSVYYSCGGITPRFFNVYKDKLIIANEGSNNIYTYDIDKYRLINGTSVLNIESPTCLDFFDI